ncbi:MAG: DEAD/DEAH box helicase, partial [bacterium]
IVVGTPGRVLDHLNRKKLILDNLAFFILDEADEMLNMGFIDDVELILKATPKEKRMLLFSATMPAKILRLAQRYMPNYEYVKIEKETLTTNLTDQIYFEVRESDKFEALSRIIDVEPEFYGLIFCRTKIDVDRVSNKLADRGYDALGIHGDIPQNQREKILAKFKNKQINILVATDVAARGIDVNDLTHVINYSLPQDPESYVHRIGRTGRAGKEGTAVTFITPYEYSKLVFIKNSTKTSIRKEEIPEIDAVIEIKKNRIVSDVKEIIEKTVDDDFYRFAEELTKDHEPLSLIAALLHHSFKDKLDKTKYNEIKQLSQAPFSVDTKGRNRLFVAMGSRKGMTNKKLVEYITDNAGVDGSSIDDVRVYDEFSFVSVPFCEAEIILKAFKHLNRGRRPIVVKAKPKK